MADPYTMPEIFDGFVVSEDTPLEIVTVLESIFPVARSPLMEPLSIYGFGRAAQWVEWIKSRSFSVAMDGRSRGEMFKLREGIAEVMQRVSDV